MPRDIKRKPLSTSTLDGLTDPQKLKLEKWLLGNMSYMQAAAVCEKEFGIRTSESAVGRFWQSFVAPRRFARRQRSAQLANQMVEEIALNPGQWDEPLKDALKETACNMLNQEQPDTEQVFFIMQCIAKAKDQELKETDIRLKRDKFEFDAAKAALKHLDALREIKARKGMDQNERLRQARLRLFGTAPE